MAITQTYFIDLKKLKLHQKYAHLLIRLMMACNDISVVNQCLRMAKDKDHSPFKEHVRRGAGMYFVRLQCGHLHEAMKIIEEIKNDPEMYDKVKHCSDDANNCFENLVDCLESGPSHRDFEKYVSRIRHQTTFHYDENKKVFEKALDKRINTQKGLSQITRGDDITLWRFQLADDIVDTIVCRQIWGIPDSDNLSQEADAKADFGSKLCVDFLDFCGEFIFNFIKENASC